MKYTKWCDGDVHIKRKSNGYFHCVNCPLMDNMEDAIFKKRSDILAHMRQHTKEGHRVPDLAFVLLQVELQNLGEEAPA